MCTKMGESFIQGKMLDRKRQHYPETFTPVNKSQILPMIDVPRPLFPLLQEVLWMFGTCLSVMTSNVKVMNIY